MVPLEDKVPYQMKELLEPLWFRVELRVLWLFVLESQLMLA